MTIPEAYLDPGSPTSCNTDLDLCYWLYDLDDTWYLARDYCHAKGLYMLTLPVQEEYTWFQSNMA